MRKNVDPVGGPLPVAAPPGKAAAPADAVIEARVEQLARIERLLWSTAVAAEVEPWTTPGRVTATTNHGDGGTGD